MGDDESLWRELVGGQGSVFAELWDRHHRRVFHHVVGMGLPPSDAEEVTATAFLEAWRNRRRVRFVEGSLLPWLLVTARNCSRNAERAQRRYRALLNRLPPPESAPDPAAVHEDRIGNITDAMRSAVGELKPIDADLFSLRAEGYSLRDAAHVLGISESAAKMRTLRVRNHFQSVRLYTESGGS